MSSILRGVLWCVSKNRSLGTDCELLKSKRLKSVSPASTFSIRSQSDKLLQSSTITVSVTARDEEKHPSR
jgi:hypothetical protein